MKIKNNKKSSIILDIKKKGKNSNKNEKEEYDKEAINEIQLENLLRLKADSALNKKDMNLIYIKIKIKEELLIIYKLNVEIKKSDLLSNYINVPEKSLTDLKVKYCLFFNTYIKGKNFSFYEKVLIPSNVPSVLKIINLNFNFDKKRKDNKPENLEIEQNHQIVLDNTINNKDMKSFKKDDDSIPVKLSKTKFDSKLLLNKIIGLYHIIFFLLFLKLFPFSSQIIKAVFFCDDELIDVNIVEGTTQTKIADGNEGNEVSSFVFGFESLNAAPGDLIRITCLNYYGPSFGAGCFVLSNDCKCFNFNNNINRINGTKTKSYTFENGLLCSMSVKKLDVNDLEGRYYTYEHYIPLNASEISCQNTDDVILVNYGENLILNLTNYITADFELKNLEVRITENYNYFSLNNHKFTENEKFRILNNITFNSIDSKKHHIIFENLGIVFNNTKECDFYIRVCHKGCSGCIDEDTTEKNYKCINCSEGFYFVENTNNCKTKQEIDLTKYYLDETDKIFKKSKTDCKTNLDDYLEDYITDEYFNTTDIEKGNNEIIKCEDILITLSTTEEQKDSKNNIDTTIIDLSECEDILRKEYNISEKEFIFMKKIEVFEKGMKTPKIVYDVYSKLNGINLMKLNLSHCSDVKINILIPIDLNNENLDKYNSSSDYYNSMCYKATSDTGTDINLIDRKNEFIEKNMSICQESCFFSEYDYDNKRAKCSCNIKETYSSLKEIKFDKSKLFNNFIDVKNIGNIAILPCYKVLFCKEGIIKNYGSYFIIFIFLLHIILIILFFAKRHFEKIKFKINDINYAIKNWKLIIEAKKRRKIEKKLKKKKEKDEIINEQNKKITKKEKKIKDKQKYKPKKDKQKQKHKQEDKKEDIQEDKKEETIFTPINLEFKKDKKKKVKKHSTRNKIKNKINNHKKLKDKSIIDIKEININNINELILINNNNNINNIDSKNNKELSNEIIDQKVIERVENIMQYNYDEINDLDYEEARKRDQRTYCLYYLSLIKTNHEIIFTFFLDSDYNSKIIKIDLFLISFTLFFAINTIFFDDDNMHKIYEDKGTFNLAYQLPNIIYSSLISYIFKFILDLLALSEGLILKLKEDKTTKDLDNRVKSLKRNIKIKFSFYFLISTILLLCFWYYVGIFCAVYVNTQIHLIKDTAISYLLSLVSPIFTMLIPGLFRIPALSNRKKNRVCLYNASKILQMIL